MSDLLKERSTANNSGICIPAYAEVDFVANCITIPPQCVQNLIF